MANDFKSKSDINSPSDQLDDLLQDVTDEKEKGLLSKAWHALSGMAVEKCGMPEPSKELEMIFRKGSNGLRVDEEMSDDELEMLAAAGTQGDTLIGGAGNDYLAGGSGDDVMDGGAGDDILFASGGDDTLSGGEGRDFMLGGAGDDVVDGGAGDDRMSGANGNDTLIGGAGNDIMAGGSGGDVFVFDANSGNDTITDFNPMDDSLQFQGMEGHEVSMVIENGNTIITYGNSTITLTGVELDEGTYW